MNQIPRGPGLTVLQSLERMARVSDFGKNGSVFNIVYQEDEEDSMREQEQKTLVAYVINYVIIYNIKYM